MTRLDDIETLLDPHHLAVFGGFHPGPNDGAPDGTATVLMLGPKEPGFWAHVSAHPVFQSAEEDSLDRWSRKVIGQIACDLGGKAVFPFGGPPYRPFLTWALKTGRAWQSPVQLLVHDTAGLMVSYRGALALRDHVELLAPALDPPCKTCAQPCLSACPATALTTDGYDVAACHAYLDTADGQDCLSQGCAVRRICPLSQSYGRRPEQSAFHMQSFHP